MNMRYMEKVKIIEGGIPIYDVESRLRIEFEDASRLRNYLNKGQRLFNIETKYPNWNKQENEKDEKSIFKISKIIKIRHKSLIVNATRYTLREFNLDVLLG